MRSKDTTSERAVRRLVHRLGYRFRLHASALPGTPDIVLPRLRKVIDVRGCFWHGHSCGRCRIPASRRASWRAKIERNRTSDRRTSRALRPLGWRVLVVWECQAQDDRRLTDKLTRFLAA